MAQPKGEYPTQSYTTQQPSQGPDQSPVDNLWCCFKSVVYNQPESPGTNLLRYINYSQSLCNADRYLPRHLKVVSTTKGG